MSLAAGVIAGTAGASLSNLVLAPLYAANQYIGSFYFGNGMILGERDMYQEDWPKIKLRLDKGESFLSILEEKTTKNTTAVMGNAKQIVIQMTPLWYQIVTSYIKAIPTNVIDALNSVIDTTSNLGGSAIPQNPTDPTAWFPQIAKLLTNGITLNVAGLDLGSFGTITPPAFGAGTPPPPPPQEQVSTVTEDVTFTVDEPHWPSLTLAEAQKLRNHMRDLNQDTLQPKLFANLLLFIKLKIQNVKDKPVTTATTLPELGRTSQILHAKLQKYAGLYVQAIKTIASLKQTIASKRGKASTGDKFNLQNWTKKKNLYRDIFNLALKQSKNYKDLVPYWAGAKPLQ